MATTMRSVDTRFWIDGWVRKLNALDRYVFLYFLTNPHSSWCGVYEVDLGMISFETGVEVTELTTVILPRLAPKVLYVEGWVYIPNFERYHANHSEKTQKGIENAWKAVPEKIRLKIRNTYPLDGVSASASASSSAYLGGSEEPQGQLKDNKKNMGWHTPNDNDSDLPVVGEDGEIKKEIKTSKRTYKEIYELFKTLGPIPLNWTLNTTQQTAAENLYTERGLEKVKNALEYYKEHKGEEYLPEINTPYDLDAKWSKLFSFKKKNG